MTPDQYKSNMFKFRVNSLGYYCAPLITDEPAAWNALQGRELETGPYYVGNGKAYFTDSAALRNTQLRAIADLGKTRKKKIDKVDNDATARIVGSLLYKAFHIFFLQSGFQCLFKGLYHKQTDYYVKTLKRDEGTYHALRGIAPKIHAVDQVLFLQTNSDYRIEIDDIKKYKMWSGFKVKVHKEKGYFILKELDLENENATLIRQEIEVIIPLESMYIPATPATLRRRGVLMELQEFSQFRDSVAQSEYAFMDRACEDLGVQDHLRLPLDKSERQAIPFIRYYFKEV